MPDSPTTQTENHEAPEEFIQRIVTALDAGRFGSGTLVPDELAEPSPEEIQEGWDVLTSVGGEFKQIQSVEHDPNAIEATLTLEETAALLRVRYTDSGSTIDSVELTQQASLAEQAKLVYGYLKGKAARVVRRLGTTEPQLTAPQDHIERSMELFESCRAGEFTPVYDAHPPEKRSQLSIEQLERGWNQYAEQIETVVSTEYDEESGRTEITFISESGTLVLESELTETGDLSRWFIRQAGAQETDYTPPEYEQRDQFTQHAFTITTGSGEAEGRVTVPQGVSDPSVIMLLPGSGPHDFDVSVGGTKLFRDLAVGLANHGIATIRTEKLTPDERAAHSLDRLYMPLIDESLTEAQAIDDVSFGAKYLLGHSLGGHLVGELADQSVSEFDGLIALSAPARQMNEVVADQVEYVQTYSGPLSEQGRREIEAAESVPETVRDASDDEVLFDLPVSFWRELLQHSPVETISGNQSLVLCGGRDWRLGDEDFEAWSHAATNDGTLEYELYDQLDHWLMHTETAESPLPGQETANLEYSVVARIAEWT